MSPRTLATALIEAETHYLDAMIAHEAQRTAATYAVMAEAARRLELLEALESWWDESAVEEAANASPFTVMQAWRGVPR